MAKSGRKTNKTVSLIENNTEEKETLNIKDVLNKKYVFIDEISQILELGFNMNKNVILWGKGGHGKSEIAIDFFKLLGIEPFVKTMGSGTTTDTLFGGVDIKKFNETGKLEYLVENSFMAHEYVIFEELFDANDYILEQVKDILSSGIFRNGAQQYKIKTKYIISCTNKSREEFAKNRSLQALMERFPYELEVKWNEYTSMNYEKLFNKTRGTSDPLLVYVLEEYSKKGVQISPRIALTAFDTLIKCGPDCLKYIADFKKNIEILTTSISKFKSIAELQNNVEAFSKLKQEFTDIKYVNSDDKDKAANVLKEISKIIDKCKKLKVDDSVSAKAAGIIKSMNDFYDSSEKELALMQEVTNPVSFEI